MKLKTPQTGSVVQSIQGRDKGNYYIVSQTLGGKVAVVDGVRRKLSDPKLKNLKHLIITPARVDFEKDGAYDVRVAHYLKNFKP